MQKKIMGVIGIGAALTLGACHHSPLPPQETVLSTLGNAPVPKWVSSPHSYRFKKEAEAFKVFIEKNTVPWSDKGWSFADNPMRKACVAVEADEEAALPNGKLELGSTNQKMFWVKAKQADGKIVLHSFCKILWKKTLPKLSPSFTDQG